MMTLFSAGQLLGTVTGLFVTARRPKHWCSRCQLRGTPTYIRTDATGRKYLACKLCRQWVSWQAEVANDDA